MEKFPIQQFLKFLLCHRYFNNDDVNKICAHVTDQTHTNYQQLGVSPKGWFLQNEVKFEIQ